MLIGILPPKALVNIRLKKNRVTKGNKIMYVAINNKHESYNWFIDFVKSLDPKTNIRRYDAITYIESEKTVIRFIDFTTMQVACEQGRGFNVRLFSVIHDF